MCCEGCTQLPLIVVRENASMETDTPITHADTHTGIVVVVTVIKSPITHADTAKKSPETLTSRLVFVDVRICV